MTYATATPQTETESGWHHLTRAFVGGLAAASAMFFHIAVVQTPGLDPPPETAALFLVAATAGVVSYLLLSSDDTLGYALAALTGLFVVIVVGLVVLGLFGTAGTETNPVGPVAYVLLAVAVVVTSGLSWRARAGTKAHADSATSP
ncbi:hypothetical protein C440_13064 [Haloferax mucosum ATCC BAA-1512]|uniref:Uncharacterized protein n=1 Tax=Haloferax mucosum ATCC BAA-1512 TaxID=662479 RepID=M0I379_9EURY|nr:hypothetical protein [Haloferax mucosum]ELZ91245.1 hypothetical protein C440_13064 [Haloferax mucosum ATCC BAA-1512]